MDNQNQNNFMDKRTLIAIALVGILFIGWQSYLKNKYGNQAPVPATGTAQKAEPLTSENGGTPAVTPAPTVPSMAEAAQISVAEKLLKFENQNISFELSSKGMGLRNFVLKNLKDRDHNPMKLGTSDNHTLYQLDILGQIEDLDFNVTQKTENQFEGVAQYGKTQIRRTMNINPETDAIENTVFIENVDASFPGVSVMIPDKAIEATSGSFLSPSFERQEFIVVHAGTEERINSSASSEKIGQTFPAVSLLGLGSQYFTSAMVDKSAIIPEANISGGLGSTEVLAQLNYKPIAGNNTMDIKWLAYSGGKSMVSLEKIDKELAHVVDLGFFTMIGRVLLKTMQWFHAKIGNWGVAIVLLTLLVRILVLPLNVSTFRSTKKMQQLQPKIAALRERFKDDPQAMNREMMNVWKENKVNPLGGCLPMLLQLPIFFALYRVLGESIELYQAPFFGWINDLSLKDPFYILPVLMAICMFIQQKMTPTTMDPTQAKVMQFLPLIFALMMMSLPSGLTLYIFINTLSGIILQQLFMRDKASAVTTKAAKA